jgi:DNA-binding response OmpR family regulator
MLNASGRRRPVSSKLTDMRVMVVEDDYFLAAELAEALRDNGATVLGPVSTVDQGRQLARELPPDCVLLDINLHGSPSLDLADELQARGVPLIFTTGYDSGDLPAHFQATACLNKPLNIPRLVEFIRASFGRSLQ